MDPGLTGKVGDIVTFSYPAFTLNELQIRDDHVIEHDDDGSPKAPFMGAEVIQYSFHPLIWRRPHEVDIPRHDGEYIGRRGRGRRLSQRELPSTVFEGVIMLFVFPA